MERRSYKRVGAPEVRAAADGTSTLTGYASVYNSYSQNLGGFVEMISPRAFDQVLADPATSVMALFNHDSSRVLGGTDAGTLTIETDTVGLRYHIALNGNDAEAASLAAKVARGDVRGSSFAFATPADGSGETWTMTDQGFPLRTITQFAGLYDVGPVTYPAYRATADAGLAAALRSLSASANVEIEELMAAAGRNELRSYLPGSNPGTSTDAPGSNPGAYRVDILRRRLALLARA
jgi:HK97 family phage prohead protease